MMNLAGYIATRIAPQHFGAIAQVVAQAPPPAPAPGEDPAVTNARRTILTWIVFIGCLVCSVLGVVASFFVLGSTISLYKLWGFSIVIAVGMISLSYGQKYAVEASRTSFTPVDLVSYVIQGFLWPSTWPSLAQAIGIASNIVAPSAPTPGKGADNLFNLFMYIVS